jgi:cobalt-zinc-cadmium efflux system membrane fusion protein
MKEFQRNAIIATALLLLAGCTRQKEPVQAEAAPPSETAGPSTRYAELDPVQIKEAGIQWAEVTERTIPQTVRVNGRLTVDEDKTWHVGAVTQGRVIRVFANAGDTVRAGQVLARMHSHDIHEARSEYKRAKAEVTRLIAQEAYARRIRDRAHRLYELKAASLEQVEHAESEWRKASTDLENARTEQNRTRIHLEEFLQVPAEEPADHEPGEMDHDEDLIPVKAPATGKVLRRLVNLGSVVNAGEEMFEISDLSSVWMIAAVGEDQLSKIRLGMPVRVEVQAYPGVSFPGRIVRIGDTLDPATRTAPVRVALSSASGKLKPEMYAAAEIASGASAPALFVPEAAIQEFKNQKVVFVRAGDGQFEPRPVSTGRLMDGETEILGGLKPGEQVVTKGAFILKSQLMKASLAEE